MERNLRYERERAKTKEYRDRLSADQRRRRAVGDNRDADRARQGRYRSKPEAKKKLSARRIERRYGITYEQFLVEAQDGCRICGTRDDLVIDHCHSSGEFRGILCNHCNKMLGFARDNPQILRSGALYLERSN